MNAEYRAKHEQHKHSAMTKKEGTSNYDVYEQ